VIYFKKTTTNEKMPLKITGLYVLAIIFGGAFIICSTTILVSTVQK
jgi:hypothetical protein